MTEQPSETTIFEEGEVKITNKRAIFGGKTYPIGKITSVEMKSTGGASGCAFVLIIGGIIALVGGAAMWGTEPSSALRFLVNGGLALLVGLVWQRLRKPTHSIQVSDASGTSTVMKSSDKVHVNRIVQAMNDVIVGRE